MPIILLMLGLLIGVVVKSIGKYIKVPYTVALFAVGLILGIIYRFGLFGNAPFLEAGIDQVSNMNPDFVLYAFLPILIFDAAYEMNLHVFKKTLLNASILAGPGLVICMLLTAAFIMLNVVLFPESAGSWNWTYALMFGGLISATDPVAVVALLQELKTSKRFSTLVDGESLLNDGTGIVCFMLFYGAFAGNPTTMGPVTFFIWVCLASFVIGFIIAKLTLWFVTKVSSEEIVQNSVMIIAAYVTFILAQKTLDVSGVIALVVFGHIFAQSGRPLLKPRVNEFMSKFWGFLAHLANTLIFIIVGVIIATKVNVNLESLLIVFGIYIALNVIRYIMIVMLYPIIKHCGYGLSKRESIILGWGGLRGALGMSLALMVHYTTSIPEDIRDSILLFTAGVVTLTLCINATTSKWLLNKLKLVKSDSPARNRIDNKIQSNIRQQDMACIESLKNEEALQGANWNYVSTFVPKAVDFDDKSGEINDFALEVRMMVLDKARSTTNSIYEQGIITKRSYSKLIEGIEDQYDSEGDKALNEQIRISPLKLVDTAYHLGELIKNIFPKLGENLFIANAFDKQYDLIRGYILIQLASKELLAQIDKSDLIGKQVESQILSMIESEINSNIEYANACLDKMRTMYPALYNNAVTKKAVRMLLAEERCTVLDMQQKGIISEEETENIIHRIDERQNLGIRD